MEVNVCISITINLEATTNFNKWAFLLVAKLIDIELLIYLEEYLVIFEIPILDEAQY